MSRDWALIPWSLGVEALILCFLGPVYGKDGCGLSQQIPEICVCTYLRGLRILPLRVSWALVLFCVGQVSDSLFSFLCCRCGLSRRPRL